MNINQKKNFNMTAVIVQSRRKSSISQHIKIKYFFITEKIKEQEMKVLYCPTEEMLADFYTKPLQGRLFRIMREIIMGMRPISDLKLLNNVQIKERVGNMT